MILCAANKLTPVICEKVGFFELAGSAIYSAIVKVGILSI